MKHLSIPLESPYIRRRQKMSENPAISGAFPTTRYYGSKRRHLHWLYHHLAKRKFKTALDVFGGTGSVALLMEKMGAQVDFHDSANFNYRQALGLTRSVSLADVEKAIALVNSVQPSVGYISTNFDGKYFTQAENSWLDGYLNLDRAIKTSKVRQLLFYSVAQACLQKRPFNLFHRENLSLRLNATVPRSFGNATTWNRTFPELANRHIRTVHELFQHRKHSTNIRVLKPQSPLALASGYDLVYLDPPYLSANRAVERYMLRYHFLEGLSAPHRWRSISKDRVLPSGSNEEWEDKRAAQALLSSILRKHRKSIVVLSYASEGVPTVDTIVSLFGKYFREIELHSYSARRSLSSSSYSDVLIIGIP